MVLWSFSLTQLPDWNINWLFTLNCSQCNPSCLRHECCLRHVTSDVLSHLVEVVIKNKATATQVFFFLAVLFAQLESLHETGTCVCFNVSLVICVDSSMQYKSIFNK